MNIMMIHPHDLFDSSEPWTIRIKKIAEEFAKKHHNVRICYFPLTFNRQYSSANMGSIELIPLDRTPSPKAFILNIKKLLPLCGWADIVHFQKCQHYASIPAVIAAYIAGKPLHYDWDDWEEKIWYESCGRTFHSGFIGNSFKILERYLPVLSDSVSCASGHLKYLAQKSGVKKERIFDSPVGADLEMFNPSLDGSRIKRKYNITGEMVLYIGQLHGAQYVDLFIKAANIVLHKKPGAVFIIAGEGFLEHKLRERVYDMGIENKVIFTGSVPHAEIPFYIAASDVCVAAFKETEVTICKSPLKIVEYLAGGKAIVASNVGEVRKMAGGAGILVEPSSYHCLADGIILLLEKKDVRENLGKRARRRAEESYNWAYTANNILEAYHSII
jgi:glycosyltransferase involved in cell wall biosynthesis